METKEKKKRPTNCTTSKVVNVRMPNQTRAELFAVAERIGVPVSQIVICSVRKEIAQIESDLIIYGQVLNRE